MGTVMRVKDADSSRLCCPHMPDETFLLAQPSHALLMSTYYFGFEVHAY